MKRWFRVYQILRLKAKARKLAKRTNVDHYVIMWLGKPEIISRDGFEYLRQTNIFPELFTVESLKGIAIYHAKA